LVGLNSGSITDAYATGLVIGGVSGGGAVNEGGLVGSATGGTITDVYSTGVIAIIVNPPPVGVINEGGLAGNVVTSGTITNGYWNQTRSGVPNGVGVGSSTGVTGLSGANVFTLSSYAGFNASTTPGATGNAWVIVDTDGTLNNAGGAAGGTMPMLASEASTNGVIQNAHQLQLMAMNLSGNYTLAGNIDASATASSSDVWGPSGFAPIGGQTTAYTGTFNGAGFTISNLTITATGTVAQGKETDLGLFGRLGSGGTIENVGLVVQPL
jgi:hypothetical protein